MRKLSEMDIFGGMKLADYLQTQQIGVPEFASAIRVHPQSVYRYLDGTRVPRPKVMALIAEATAGKVGPADFYPDLATAAAE